MNGLLGFTDGIGFEIRDEVAHITIDRPQRRNALDDAAQARLHEIWSALEADQRLRAAVLTGSGDRAFCAGADMSPDATRSGIDYWAHVSQHQFGGLNFRRNLDIPVIGKVNGAAMGGGFVMLLGCDLIIAADHAKFALSELRVGRNVNTAAALLLHRVDPATLREMVFTGRTLGAGRLRDAGLINEVVPGSELDAALDRWLKDIAACAPLAIRAVKQFFNRASHLPASEASTMRLPALIKSLESTDADEGVKAFLEKRAPQWSGK